jgi:hypothetical protein
LTQIVVDRKGGVERKELVGRHLVERFLRLLVALFGTLHQIADSRLFLGHSLLRRRQVDEHELRAALGLPLVIEPLDIVGRDVDLGASHVAIARGDEAHVERRLAGVGHDLEHVVGALLDLLGQVLGTPDQRAFREFKFTSGAGATNADIDRLIGGALDDNVLRLAAAHLGQRQRLADRRELRFDVVIGDDVGKAERYRCISSGMLTNLAKRLN